MKELFKKWNEISLIKRIVTGLVIGAILGVALPNLTVLTILGSLFVGALRAVAPVLVFILVVSALASSKSEGGGNMKTVIILYVLSTFLAAVAAVIFSFASPVNITLAEAAEAASAPEGVGEVIKNILMNAVSNPVASIVDGNYIGILTWEIGRAHV